MSELRSVTCTKIEAEVKPPKRPKAEVLTFAEPAISLEVHFLNKEYHDSSTQVTSFEEVLRSTKSMNWTWQQTTILS